MSKLRKNRSGFTLIELMVVVIIVAVLAAVAVPLMQGNINNARSSEAAASLGMIRTNLRTILSQTGFYPTIAAGTNVVGATGVQGMQANDLLGRYFDDDDFTITSSATPAALNPNGTYCINLTGNSGVNRIGAPGGAQPNGNTAPNADEAATVIRSMDQNGDIRTVINCPAATAPIN